MKVHPRERECGDDSGDSNLLQTDVAGELPSMLGEFHKNHRRTLRELGIGDRRTPHCGYDGMALPPFHGDESNFVRTL